MIIGALILAFVAVLVPVIVGLCASGQIGRNPLIGLRLPALFASDEAWRTGHKAALLPTVMIAVACVVLAVVVVFVAPFALIGTYLILAILLIGVVVAGVIGGRAATAR